MEPTRSTYSSSKVTTPPPKKTWREPVRLPKATGLEGTGYPIIDDGGNIFDDYDGAYYPTIYTICPNRMLTESGQVTSADHADILFANDCAAATMANDGAVLELHR